MNLDNYYNYPQNKTDGFYPYCIPCAKFKANKHQYENYAAHMRLVKRNDDKPERKIKNRENSKRQRLSGYNKWWQQQNPDKLKIYNRDRADNRKHEITKLEWFYCLYYFNNSCAYCGMTWEEHMITYGQDLHKEHLIHDGRNDLKNCVPSCRSCNSEKHVFTLNEWYNKENPKYDRIKYLRVYQWIRYDALRFIEKKKTKSIRIS